MDDRELLEKAALAAGIPTVMWNDGSEPYSSGTGFILINNHVWNSLTNDGDCHRMEVTLKLCAVWIEAEGRWMVGTKDFTFIHHHKDRNRASTMAAASIGAERKGG